MKYLVFSITLISVLTLTRMDVDAQPAFNEYLQTWQDHRYFKHASVGFSAFDIDEGKIVSNFNGHKSLIPASSLKILSSLIILDKLGENYKYKSNLVYNGTIGPDGTLQGDLIFKGSGDPTLGSDRFENTLNFERLVSKIVSEIQQAGIKCIDGDFIVDKSIFDSNPVGDSWQYNDLGNYYAGGAWGVNIRENEYDVLFNSNGNIGSKAKIEYTNPVINNLVLESEVTIEKVGSGDNAYIYHGPYVFQKKILGTIPKSKSLFKIRGAIPNPPKLLGEKIIEALTKKNILVDGLKVRSKAVAQEEIEILYSTPSPNLREMVVQANRHSINQFCETFTKTMAVNAGKLGTTENGLNVIEKYLGDLGIDTKAVNLLDGSGLSSRNLISADVLASFLGKYASRHGTDNSADLLPKAGVEGTVRNVLLNSPAKGNIWMKSGSIDHVISYTGICKTKSGKNISFCIIVNNYSVKYREVRSHIMQLIEAIYLEM